MSARTETVELDDLPEMVGRTFSGETFTISRSERDAFEAITWVSEAYDTPDLPEFPSDIVEGFHLLSLIDPLSMKLLKVNPEASFGFNYGLDRVRFIEPILIGQPLTFQFEITGVRRKGDGYLMLRTCRMDHVGQTDRPAMIADWWTLSLPGGNQ